ncbi:MAG: SDR family oxidoreductase [Betaproteobacteria bacterium]
MSKLVLITGASSGIGAETARLMASEGWEVVLVARDASRLQGVAKSMGARAHVERCDAADGHAVLSMAARVRTTLGVPDCPRRSNFDPPCRLNCDPGLVTGIA